MFLSKKFKICRLLVMFLSLCQCLCFVVNSIFILPGWEVPGSTK